MRPKRGNLPWRLEGWQCSVEVYRYIYHQLVWFLDMEVVSSPSLSVALSSPSLSIKQTQGT